MMGNLFLTNKKNPLLTGTSPQTPLAFKKGSSLWLEKLFEAALLICGLIVLFIIAGIVLSLFIGSLPSFNEFGINFLLDSKWDPAQNKFGALPFIVGTLLVGFLALIFSLPFSLALGIFLGEYQTKGPLAGFVRSMVELMAGIPSVIYGLAGGFFLIPLIQLLQTELGLIPFGVSILTAALILAAMIIPYAASLAKEVLLLVPADLKEAAYALGATRQEVITKIALPYASSGIIAGFILSLGRALGETIAVTMLIGNMNALPENLLSPGQTIASLIANQFNEANNDLHRASLLELGLILLGLTIFFNLLGRLIINKVKIRK